LTGIMTTAKPVVVMTTAKPVVVIMTAKCGRRIAARQPGIPAACRRFAVS
jgi:hypothetical protein